MEASWYLLHILPPSKGEGGAPQPDENGNKAVTQSPDTAEQDSAADKAAEEKQMNLVIPQVGTPITHFLGIGTERSEKDSKNVLWDKIQDGVRPAWAPDFLRLGYSVIFKREGLPKLAVKLGIKNPVNVTKEERLRDRNRILTFDDVLVIGCVPHMRPMYFPDKDLDPEDWWLATKESKRVTSPYLSPKGVTVVTGAQRLADVVIQMLRSPELFPRTVPTMEGLAKEDGYAEFINPLVPLLPKGPSTYDQIKQTRYGNGGTAGTGYGGWAGLELFRNSSY